MLLSDAAPEHSSAGFSLIFSLPTFRFGAPAPVRSCVPLRRHPLACASFSHSGACSFGCRRVFPFSPRSFLHVSQSLRFCSYVCLYVSFSRIFSHSCLFILFLPVWPFHIHIVVKAACSSVIGSTTPVSMLRPAASCSFSFVSGRMYSSCSQLRFSFSESKGTVGLR